MLRKLRRPAALLVMLFTASTPGLAQEADILTGRVVDESEQPLAGARVEAMSLETEITRSAITDRAGRFMINFPDGGGRYLLRISFLGMADVVRTLVREADEELLIANVAMSTEAIALDAIEAVARRPQPTQGRTGEQSTALSQELLNRLPLPDLDPNTLAQLAAGVVTTELDSLTGRSGFSVAGMSDLLNQILLDGMVLGESALQIPQEGVRRTTVTTSTFDASRGGFAGGQVSMTSARGNNRTAGALSYSLDNDAFQLGSAATVNAYSRQNVSGSIGGPIVRNKLFYNAAFGLQRNVNHRFALSADDDVSALRAGVASDSVDRFISALAGFGMPVNGRGQYDQARDNYSLQLRADWNLVQREQQQHTLSLRVNGSRSDQDSTRINALDLTQHGGDMEGDDRAAALTLNSRMGANWTNALTASFNESWNESIPFVELPEGRVLVTSEFADATRATQTLVFGGNRNMPSDAYRKGLQVSNDLSFLLPVGSQLHRLKVGATLQRTRSVSRSQDNLLGSFSFNSIEDLERNTPARFERTLTDAHERFGSILGGIYVGDTWRISETFELTGGLRWDYSRVTEKPAYNPAVESAFGRRTDIEPVATTLSPRLGFNYRLASGGGVRNPRSISGGIGLFAGQTPTNIFARASRQTGLSTAEQQLVCIGAATPIPDWDLYLNDPSAIPETCADGTTGGVFASRAPTVSLINPDQRMPASLRAELGYRTRLPLNLNANFRYSYARGLGLWGYYDINLDESQFFLLGNEARPFFGEPSAIVPTSGQTTQVASRLQPAFGSVFDIRADRASAAHQLTTQLNGQLPKGFTVSSNYTLSFAREQSASALNPNHVEWTTSSNDRRHTINLTLTKAITPEFEIAAMARLSSGSPFTPTVSRDINGDGLGNDRAFVFNPAATSDTAVAHGMTRLLGVLPDRIVDCLSDQLGEIAERNSCRNAWARSLDMRASVRPNLPRLERRLTISVDARNILNGLDQVFNGDDLRGWGESPRVDSRLLEVRGFDPNTNAFLYQVNEAFGQNRRGSSAMRNPFALRLTARLTVGGQPVMSNRGFGNRGPGNFAMGMRRGEPGGGGAGGRGFNAVGLIDRMLANPLPVLLELKDTLGMSAEQIARIDSISQTLQTKLNARREELGQRFDNVTPQQQSQAFLELQPVIEATRQEVTAALSEVQKILTPQQWERVPDQIRNPFQRAARRRQ